MVTNAMTNTVKELISQIINIITNKINKTLHVDTGIIVRTKYATEFILKTESKTNVLIYTYVIGLANVEKGYVNGSIQNSFPKNRSIYAIILIPVNMVSNVIKIIVKNSTLIELKNQKIS